MTRLAQKETPDAVGTQYQVDRQLHITQTIVQVVLERLKSAIIRPVQEFHEI